MRNDGDLKGTPGDGKEGHGLRRRAAGAGEDPDQHHTTADRGPLEDRDLDVIPLHLFVQGKGEGS